MCLGRILACGCLLRRNRELVGCRMLAKFLACAHTQVECSHKHKWSALGHAHRVCGCRVGRMPEVGERISSGFHRERMRSAFSNCTHKKHSHTLSHTHLKDQRHLLITRHAQYASAMPRCCWGLRRWWCSRKGWDAPHFGGVVIHCPARGLRWVAPGHAQPNCKERIALFNGIQFQPPGGGAHKCISVCVCAGCLVHALTCMNYVVDTCTCV